MSEPLMNPASTSVADIEELMKMIRARVAQRRASISNGERRNGHVSTDSDMPLDEVRKAFEAQAELNHSFTATLCEMGAALEHMASRLSSIEGTLMDLEERLADATTAAERVDALDAAIAEIAAQVKRPAPTRRRRAS